ncbi:hypothetical protein L1987_65570 [Smallanthus sonchifolius]|uniref:Uncharacterized protein n=1 Tax=Smallanthus sonchifolius TaxID=185202 RepID=A0ACB9BUP2_9ASTR|nr:hypothetical protein L1987_65570 [Smallanthus sonchifolius]
MQWGKSGHRALVDTGETHNFISEGKAKRLIFDPIVCVCGWKQRCKGDGWRSLDDQFGQLSLTSQLYYRKKKEVDRNEIRLAAIFDSDLILGEEVDWEARIYRFGSKHSKKRTGKGGGIGTTGLPNPNAQKTYWSATAAYDPMWCVLLRLLASKSCNHISMVKEKGTSNGHRIERQRKKASGNRIWKQRLVDIGTVTAQQAKE